MNPHDSKNAVTSVHRKHDTTPGSIFLHPRASPLNHAFPHQTCDALRTETRVNKKPTRLSLRKRKCMSCSVRAKVKQFFQSEMLRITSLRERNASLLSAKNLCAMDFRTTSRITWVVPYLLVMFHVHTRYVWFSTPRFRLNQRQTNTLRRCYSSPPFYMEPKNPIRHGAFVPPPNTHQKFVSQHTTKPRTNPQGKTSIKSLSTLPFPKNRSIVTKRSLTCVENACRGVFNSQTV